MEPSEHGTVESLDVKESDVKESNLVMRWRKNGETGKDWKNKRNGKAVKRYSDSLKSHNLFNHGYS